MNTLSILCYNKSLAMVSDGRGAALEAVASEEASSLEVGTLVRNGGEVPSPCRAATEIASGWHTSWLEGVPERITSPPLVWGGRRSRLADAAEQPRTHAAHSLLRSGQCRLLLVTVLGGFVYLASSLDRSFSMSSAIVR
jgi:hypothetical protein